MYNLLANETAASLRAFFQNTLPSLAEDWWARHVVNALTFQQQRRALESRIESLAGLDLAALIRVLDQIGLQGYIILDGNEYFSLQRNGLL